MHVALSTYNLFLFPGYIYVIGGCNDEGKLRTVEQYHMEKERWTHAKSLDRPIENHAAAANGEMVSLWLYKYLLPMYAGR